MNYTIRELKQNEVNLLDKFLTTQIQSYNLRDTLNKQGNKKKGSIEFPISTLPTRIVSLEYKPGSKNTLELYLMVVSNLVSEFIMLRLRLNQF